MEEGRWREMKGRQAARERQINREEKRERETDGGGQIRRNKKIPVLLQKVTKSYE